MFKKTYFFVGLVLALFSCKSQKSSSALPLELIVTEDYSGAEEEEIIIVRTEKELHSFFAKVNRTRKPGLPIPVIDFTKDLLIIWCSDKSYTTVPELIVKEETQKTLIFKQSSKDIVVE